MPVGIFATILILCLPTITSRVELDEFEQQNRNLFKHIWHTFSLASLNLPMILQLDPAILVETPLGTGFAIMVIDYGMHQNTCWIVALQENGIIKHFDCNDIILSTNYTYGLNLTRNTNHPVKGKKD